jgi:class 3 adenylate cyclase/tetratricopeptide (TPR) repeat protein
LSPEGTVREVVCSKCGASWPGTFKFCGACGASLEGTQRAHALEERKVVTALFADLAASTEMATRLDPEDLRAVLTPFFAAMAEEIERYGGTVQKYIGDAIVAVFGVPAAHEDDPERAVRAALAMQRRLPRVSDELAGGSGERLAMRIGVNTGEVVTATGIDREALVTGEAVNIAARFQALAQPGGVVVGERTYRDTRDAVRYRPLGEVTVKGIERPLSVWEAVGEAAQPAGRGGAPGLAPMVGRDEELELLELLLARTAREGRPSLVTVVGPPGIGKSRLCREFLDRAGDRRSLRVVRGRCLPYGEGLTYWPLAEILKSDAGVMDSDPPEAIRDKMSALLDTLFGGDRERGTPQVLLSSIGLPVDHDPLAGAEPPAARELIGTSWRRYFELLTNDGSVVALIDDLHWADEGLLDLVESVAARGGGPLLILGTSRPELSERRPGWGGGLRNASTIYLSPLSTADGEQLVRHLLNDAPAPRTAVEAVLSRAEGNPFFAQELLRMVIDSGALVRPNGEWVLQRPLPAELPDTVQGVIASRIDLLPATEKRILQDAAVVGRTFWRGALERLVGESNDAALAELVEKGLVWERDASVIQGEREFVFNHVLTTDVAYAGIPRSRRAGAHAGALAWMEEVTSGRAEEFAEILAHHAERAGDDERTARYALLAGHRSRRVFAAAEAIRWYDRALEAAARAGGDQSALVSEAALEKGEALEQLGSFAEADADYRRALEAARSAGDGALEARALAALAHVLWLQDRFDAGDEVLDRALARAREIGANQLLAQLLYTAGTLAFGRGRYASALVRHQEALAVARAAGDLAGEALARHGLCETKFFLGPFDEALAEGQRADRLFRDLGQRLMTYHNLYMVAAVLWLKGRVSEALDAWKESAAGSKELGNRRDEGFARGAALSHISGGKFGAALEDFSEAIRIALEIRTPRLELAVRASGIGLFAELGAFDRVESELAECWRVSDGLGSDFYRPRLFAWDGWMALRRGDPASAESLFAKAHEEGRASLYDHLWTALVELLAGQDGGDRDRVASANGFLAEVDESESPVFAAWAVYGRALAAALGESWAEALELAERCEALSGDIGEKLLVWRAADVASRALLALGRHQDAEVERSKAAGILQAMAETIGDEELRASFEARPVVAGILAEGSTSVLLSGFSPGDIGGLFGAGSTRRYGEGERVFRAGDPGSDVYFVREGRIRIEEPGTATAMARLGPSEFFGEGALLEGGPRTFDAVAEQDSVLVEVPRDDVLRFLVAHPAAAERLVAIATQRLRQDEGIAPGQPFVDVASQLIETLQGLAASSGARGPAVEILPVFVLDGAVRWLRPAGSDSLVVDAGEAGHPGQAVIDALGAFGVPPRAVHSTSWRTDGGRLLVTYLAVLDPPQSPPPGMREVEVRRRTLARGSATGPPPAIEVDQVIEHALRHLAWLLGDDAAIAELLGAEWEPALEGYTPEPFRSLDEPRFEPPR